MLAIFNSFGTFLSRKNVPLFLSLLTTISIVIVIATPSLFSFILLPYLEKVPLTRTSATLTGIVRLGVEDNSRRLGERMYDYLETPQRVYYLTDRTSEISRSQKTTLACGSGLIYCYEGKKVQIKGYFTNRKLLIKRFFWADKSPSKNESVGPWKAQELVVLSFEVVE